MSYPNNANQYLPGTIQTPSALVITAITNSYPMVVTIVVNPVNEANTYLINQLVRFTIPYSYQMFQLNGITGQIISVNGSNLTLDIDSTNFDAFVVPATPQIPASLSPAGSRNLEYNNTNAKATPFQSLNNRGN